MTSLVTGAITGRRTATPGKRIMMMAEHLPTVTWRGHKISRLILGHNPLKGHAHLSKELNDEMEKWFSDRRQGVDLLRRCHEQGVNTAQFGRGTFDLLCAAHFEGFAPNWIATLYDDPQGRLGTGRFPPMTVEAELKSFECVRAPLIGYQYFGESTDQAYLNGQLGKVRTTIDWLRGKAGDRLVGVCTHLPDVVREIDQQDWPIDFLQTSLYTVYSDRERKTIDRKHERFDASDAQAMIEVIHGTRFPCIVFKVLGSGRSCNTSGDVREALAVALNNIKESDVVCVGMWQKHRDQVEENARFVREILASRK